MATWCKRSSRSPWILACFTCISTQKPQPFICEARISTRCRIDGSIDLDLSSMPNSANFLNRSGAWRSEEHTSELQSRENLVCRLLLEKKKYRDRKMNSDI